ncbi:MAG: hypothetical protein M1833_000531 [Piccolia ochrophora]|nr:MAG: hypothetical protein M1833_000531 [Piccolia ochrophora]
MDEETLNLGGSPTVDSTSPSKEPPAQPQPEDGVPTDQHAIDTVESAENPPDPPNAESADPTIATHTTPPADASTSIPPPISDNPLDAPDAPRPQAEADESREDEEMVDASEQPKKENESPEKETEAVHTPAQPEEGATMEQPAPTKTSIESSARSHLMTQTHAIILPSYSAWFDMHTIHALEKKALPEFFNNRNRSKTPVVYKDYRDFMINTYRLNPVEYLTVTACRRNLAGDVCCIMRVHAFLEQWGLINYQVDAEVRPSNIGPPFTGHFRVTADTPRGLQPFQPAPGSKIQPGKPFAQTEQAASGASAQVDLNMHLRQDVYHQNGKHVASVDSKNGEKQANGDTAVTNGTEGNDSARSGLKAIEDQAKEPMKKHTCHSCGIDCTRIHYHLTPKAGAPAVGGDGKLSVDICPNCFLEARFPNSTNAADFVKIDNSSYSAIPDANSPWSDQETIKLLEGAELFDDDWKQIAEHVGTRSEEQCILKFLQLPIEDKFVDGEPSDEPNASRPFDLTQTSTLRDLRRGNVPFSQADNPVLSVIAFMAGLSNPSIAAAAASSANDAMRRQLAARIEKGIGGETAESTEDAAQTSKDVTKTEDSMEVDQHTQTPSGETSTKDAAALSKTATDPNADLAAIPFAVSASRSFGLCSHEERAVMRLINTAISSTLQKHKAKQRQFAEKEAMLQTERRHHERSQERLYADRLAFKHRVKEIESALRTVSLKGGAERASVSTGGLDADGKDGVDGQGELPMLSVDPPQGYKGFES